MTQEHKDIIIKFAQTLINKGKLYANVEYITNSVKIMFPEYRNIDNLKQDIGALLFDNLSPKAESIS